MLTTVSRAVVTEEQGQMSERCRSSGEMPCRGCNFILERKIHDVTDKLTKQHSVFSAASYLKEGIFL